MKRAIILVMDSVGMGEMPDAKKYGDEGSNTLGNISKELGGLELKYLQKLGLGNIDAIKGFEKEISPIGCYCRMEEKSSGKDTTTGHWEMAGIILEKPFPTYPEGFPEEIINAFEKAIGRKTIGNIVASGTEIIKTLGRQHVATGFPIVYTSADSVFQIAAHEEVIPIESLYEMCTIARNILTGKNALGRVIARPFTGIEGNYVRTDRRRDFSIKPIEKTILDFTVEKGLKVKAVGKIEDIFAKQGITDAVHTHNNMDGVEKTIDYMKEEFEGILFTNLVDFDMQYGHRNNVTGYANALKEFDTKIPEIISMLKDDDIMLITADHGCDPTTPSTDHSREYVPLLIYGKKLKQNINLGTRSSFTDISATISEFLNLEKPKNGKSFLKEIIKDF